MTSLISPLVRVKAEIELFGVFGALPIKDKKVLRQLISLNHPDKSDQADLQVYQVLVEHLQRMRGEA